MSEARILGPDNSNLYTYKELPIGSTSIGLPEGRKTGLWRYMRPEFRGKLSPCGTACPVGNSIQEFVRAVAEKDFDKAWATIALENPFPGVCGRVCYHLCEDSCNCGDYGGAISIQAIERALADSFSDRPLDLLISRESTGKKVAVVGAGPAGLSCAYFLRIMGYEVTVFEAHNELGGVPLVGIPSYRLPRRVLEKEVNNILALGIEVKKGCKVGRDVQFSELLATYDALFLGVGAHNTTDLKLSGSDCDGVFHGLQFLAKFNETGIFEGGERVLVIGGGNVAIDVARTLVRLGRCPIVAYRRTRDEMPAHPEEISEAEKEGVTFQYLLSPTAIEKHSKAGLRVACDKMKIDGEDLDGRRRVTPIEGETIILEADQVILATGEIPDFSFMPSEFTQNRNFLWVNECGQTKLEKVFAGGDLVDQPRSVSHAIGSAKRTAIVMDHFLRGDDVGGLFSKGEVAGTMREHLGFVNIADAKDKEIAEIQDLNLSYSNLSSRQNYHKLPINERIDNFEEVNLGLDLDTATTEATRCLSCGVCVMCGNCYLFCPDGAVHLDNSGKRYVIDYEYCKGCGICQNECPVGAISIEIEGEE